MHERTDAKGRVLWVGSVSLGVDAATGKRLRRAVYGKTRSEALAKVREPHTAHAGRLTGAADGLTTGRHLSDWLAGCRDRVRPGAWGRYDELVRLHLAPGLGSVPPPELTPARVEAGYAAVATGGVSASTRRAAGVALRVALRHAVRLGLIPSNPAAVVAKPRPASGSRRS